MSDTYWFTAQKIQAYAINAEIQGMIAENQNRLSRDESIAYTETDFQEKTRELYGIYNDIMQNR